ncbi:MAG TPA: choice-of-anchor Q domain-containing protein [Anaerolineae bacterium]|nr:choice-of-anchor Q domain-containing protein [Anaerolineae bacterium]
MLRPFSRYMLSAALLLASLALASPVYAGGVVGNGTSGSCTEAALNAALAGGGTVTFNCGGPKTITLTSPKTITQNTVINGGDVITLTGNLNTRLFRIEAPAVVQFSNIKLDKAFSNGSDGAAISNSGALTLTHVTIQSSITDINHSGGALFTDGPALITNSTFQNNVGGSAGAIFANFGNAKVTIVDSLFFGNQAQNATTGYGGAIWVGENAQLTLRDSAFVGNLAHFGGALYASPNGVLTLSGTTTGSLFTTQLQFNSNAATEDGGAIYNKGNLTANNILLTVNRTPTQTLLAGYGGGIYSDGALTLTNGLLQGNQGRFGGGLFVGNSATNIQAVIDRVSFISNLSGSLGGGLYTNSDTTAITVTNSVFDRNTAASGGGLARFNAGLRVFNSSFTQNTAMSGGGLSLNAGPAPSSGPYVHVQSVTVSGNTATSNQGGGVYNSGLLELYFTTIVSNTNGAFNVGNANTRFRSTVLHNPGSLNCDGDGSGQISNDAGNHVTDSSCGPQFTVVGSDPKLGPLQNDGTGATYYHLPQAGSPLINTGYSNCPERDQRGASRPDACDIGAVEFGGRLPRVFVPLVMRQP